MKPLQAFGLLSILAPLCLGSEEPAPRPLPQPLASHPGNIFLAGEEVVFPAPNDQPKTWRLYDYEEKEISSVVAVDGKMSLGQLPVGFYRLKQEGQSNWISCAVLTSLKSPTPAASPIALDVAMAWFYPKEKMGPAASLCALAGVNWVRDRLAWGQMEPKPEQWSATNRYDFSAQAQSEAGLRVLQVNHSSPSWANSVGKRFPLDLRHAYRFHREIAQRWQGQVLAFEPWNEADIPMFGGHTGSEMAAMQKASYLGLKAGNPEVIACLNVFAARNGAQLDDLRDNQVWPYFDTFNLHHYSAFDEYPKIYADFRAVSAGKPLWVTECAVPVKWAGDEKLKEPTDVDLRVQAERVAKTFACSLHEGSVATFYFLLPHYVEGQTQFGILRPDLTPRPAYVALAAVGRFLADAKPLGRLQSVPDEVRGFLFSAKPDGQNAHVLVAWSTKGQVSLDLPDTPSGMWDHLGRSIKPNNRLSLSPAPLFAILSGENVQQLKLQAPPQKTELLPGKPSPVVIQALWPEEKTILNQSAYRFSLKQNEAVPLFVYNFSDAPVAGRLQVVTPAGWLAKNFAPMEIPPQSRAELRLELQPSPAAPFSMATVRVEGDFGPAGHSIFSMRVKPEL